MVIVAVLMIDLLLLLVQLHLDRGLVQLVELVRQVDVLQDVLVHRDQLVRVVRLLPEHLQVFDYFLDIFHNLHDMQEGSI